MTTEDVSSFSCSIQFFFSSLCYAFGTQIHNSTAQGEFILLYALYLTF